MNTTREGRALGWIVPPFDLFWVAVIVVLVLDWQLVVSPYARPKTSSLSRITLIGLLTYSIMRPLSVIILVTAWGWSAKPQSHFKFAMNQSSTRV